MPELFRSMRSSAEGLPLKQQSSRALGARPHIDIPIDRIGCVDPGMGGMSVSPDDLMHLPDHRRPPEHGGTGRDPVWVIDEVDLGAGLVYRPDPDMPDLHGFVEPAKRMRFEEYVEALYATAGSWRRVGG
jgi:hypothetical protein